MAVTKKKKKPAKKMSFSVGSLSTRGKILAGVGAVGVAIVLLLGWMTMGMAETSDVAAAPQELEPVRQDDVEIPTAYLFQHFLDELHGCYQQIGHSTSRAELEVEVGKEWGEAVVALMEYYRIGNCFEGDYHPRIPGRVAWMINQVQAMEPAAAEEGGSDG